ncbi:MAG TPA: 23S rRNA (adenine(1618)-N(6))-methyltransferase RlmF [Bacteroidales bacterium]|nr:23S rRNA (adenine(1618)-N(6))-methyltransferase RlmF [Bacteroidales bacterium]
MLPKKKEHPKEKSKLHPRNKHRERYDFKQLIESCADLTPFVKLNLYNDESIDFANPEAVRMLNKALLKHYYNIENWNIPANYLCPPVPGRADYIHYMADLVCGSNYGNMPAGEKIKCLDVGVGANCVYPIIGMKEYGWSFVGSDIDTIAIESANKIIESNSFLKDKIEIRLQNNPKDIFYGIIQKEELFDLTICNPPFNKSAEESKQGTLRKLNNLNDSEITKPILNFGGKSNELWCKGGELKFVKNMVYQSKQFATSCFWFSTIISKQSHLSSVYEVLKKMEATEVKTISMGQGNKSSRIVAWTFFMPEQKKQWVNTRWKDEH